MSPATDNLGAAVQSHGPKGGYVELDRERYPIPAVIMINGYSAHADQKGLVEFVTGMEEGPSQVKLVHGDAAAKKELAKLLRRKYKLDLKASVIVSAEN